jgi:tRNA G18 (ribose-2'-O)-methylase SpoU
MPEIPIDSIDDPQISVYRDLPKLKLTRDSGRFVVEGRYLVERLLASDYPTDSILVAESHVERIRKLAPSGTPILVAKKQLIQEIVGFRFHRGVLACGLRKPPAGVRAVVPTRPTPATLVVLSGLMDQENVGAILRAAAAFGVDAVVLGPQCADPFSRRVVRVSMGAVLKLNLATSDDLAGDVDWLQDAAGIEVVASVLDSAADPLEAARRSYRMALLLGNEGHGLEPDLIRRCRRRVTIPMEMGTDSLNVSMAAGIFLYHFTRLSLPHPADAE